ncbi:MAG: SMC-Scp complex subunit ScpB, partial [Asgard group archaeon]|nr:SMC-Scp complex subunit ScpB [Asgard group archaeon]
QKRKLDLIYSSNYIAHDNRTFNKRDIQVKFMDEQLPFSDEEKQMVKIKNQQIIEAALYLAGRPVQITELAQVTGLDTSEISSIIRDLQEKYRQHFSCFEIIELPGRKFVFQVRADVGENVKEITLQPILTLAELRTLAMIAYQQPVMQSTVAAVRGQQAYNHVKSLIRNGFVKAIRVKQTLELRTTPMFSDYFGLSQDQGVLKRQLGWRTKRIIKEKRVEERDTQSIDSFMARIGLEGEATEETIDDVESTIPVDKDSAREMFPSMLDDLKGPDPFTEDEEDNSTDEFEENEE